MRANGYTIGTGMLKMGKSVPSTTKTEPSTIPIVSTRLSMNSARHNTKVPARDNPHDKTTPNDAALHKVCSKLEGKVEFQARKCTAPNSAPAMEEEPRRVLTSASSL